MHKLFFLAFIFLFVSANSVIQAQNVKPSVVSGEVVSVSENNIVLKQADGSTINLQITASSQFKRVQPENPGLQNAVASNLLEIGAGDKVVASGIMSNDKKSIPARSVYLMTKADIVKKAGAESEAWQTRGVSGRIISLNPNTQEFTIKPPGIGAAQNIVVSQKDGVSYRRYSPDSVRYEESKTSSFADLKIGDQIRALGDKGTDGTTFKAEKILSGSFKTVGGTITAIDTAKNEITIKELQTNKIITIAVNQNSSLKQFPEQMAAMMAMRMSGMGGGVQPPAGGGGSAPGGNVVTMRTPRQPGSQTSGGQGEGARNGMGGGRGMGGGGFNVNDMYDRFPNILLTDLKVGDSIAASSSSGADAAKLTAIKLISGVEPFFKIAQMSNMGGRRGGQDSGFTIPGFDGGGFGTP
ncbi:MAG: hypothetical protein ACR2L1_01860 [Pyrinomonadaceae bacterium]